MEKKTYLSPFTLGLFDFFLLNVSSFGMNYWKRGTFDLSPLYIKLLIAFSFIWLFVSLFTKKFRFDFYRSYRALLLLLTRSTIYIVYCVAIMVVAMGQRVCQRSGWQGARVYSISSTILRASTTSFIRCGGMVPTN